MLRFFGGLLGGLLATALVVVGLAWAVSSHTETVHWIFKNGMEVANGTQTASLTLTNTDTGNGAVVLPANSIGLGSEVSGHIDNVIFCGELAENATTFFGPATAVLGGDGSASYALGSSACDALDNTTEATVDAAVSTLAVKALGMRCKSDATLGAGESIIFTLRTTEGDAVTTDGSATTMTCTIGVGATECRSVAGTTTNIVAGATMAIKAVMSSNNSDDNAKCDVTIAWP